MIKRVIWCTKLHEFFEFQIIYTSLFKIIGIFIEFIGQRKLKYGNWAQIFIVLFINVQYL